MNYMDFNCFSGNWPFFRVRYNTVEKISQLHNRIGITGGFISALEAIFYQDPYEAELALSKELKGTNYRHAMILNPTLPGWKDDLRRALRDLDIQAIRLIPGYHNYQLTDPVAEEAAAAIAETGLPLLLTLRMMDDRPAYGIRPRPIPDDEIVAFLEKHPEIPTVLANIRLAQLKNYTHLFESRKNLVIDTSGFMAGLFPVDDAWPLVRGQMVFGSNAPLTEMRSISHIIETAAIDSSAKENIYTGCCFLNFIK